MSNSMQQASRRPDTTGDVVRQPGRWGSSLKSAPSTPQKGLMFEGNIRSALDAIRINRLRSFLTTLGVVIGVAAVIAVVTLTQGASAQLNQNLSQLGTNTLIVSPGTAGVSTQSLTMKDVAALAKMQHVVNITPALFIKGVIVRGNQNWTTSMEGVYPNYQQIQNWQIAQGRWYSASEESTGSPVAVIGQTVSSALFGGSNNPIGQTIHINGQLFRVVGLLQAKGSQGGSNQDDVIFLPFSTAFSRLKNTPYVDQIQVQVDSAASVSAVQQTMTTLLEKQHHIQAGGQDDFRVRNSNQLILAAQQQSSVLTALLVGVAAISLSVGGIGIMNIMLVSVIERTREIGIRVAIGARRRDIRNQFLIEAATLSATGGIIGILLGLLISLGIVAAIHLPFVPSILAMLIAFGIAVCVGVLFGLYPAVQASKLDPIVALRTE